MSLIVLSLRLISVSAEACCRPVRSFIDLELRSIVPSSAANSPSESSPSSPVSAPRSIRACFKFSSAKLTMSSASARTTGKTVRIMAAAEMARTTFLSLLMASDLLYQLFEF